MNAYRILGYLAPPFFFFGFLLLGFGVFVPEYREAGTLGMLLLGLAFAATFMKLEQIAGLLSREKRPGD